MNKIVLVHGAWLGAWCWKGVASELRKAGREVVVPELPGHGDDQTPLEKISLDAYVDTVAAALGDHAAKSIVVGHSMAGIVLSFLAERLPARIEKLIYVSAYLLQDGENITQVSMAATDSLVGPNMVPAADWSTIGIKPDGLKEVFAADAPDAVIAELRKRARPEPSGPFNAPVSVTPARFGSVSRFYIKTLNDRAVTPALQDAMLAKTPCDRVVSLSTSHTPFFANPVGLTAKIIDLSNS